MNENARDTQTLFELLDEYNVIVPIIQRDYAQGRQDEHSKNVRKDLLNDMRKAVKSETPPLDLGFVYGKIKGTDKENIFIPIDGQQRLTTLFLLHLYAFSNDDSKRNLLGKFTYKTRPSSRDFIKQLVENSNDVFSATFTPAKWMPSNEIKDSHWFVASWKYDPTIQSMLTMLDAIEETFCDIKGLLVQCLTDMNSKPLNFKFLPTDKLGNEDSLYIKLNARGRPLTSFENFKAQLIGVCKKQISLPFTTDEFERHLDDEWTHLFWENAKRKAIANDEELVKDFNQTYLAFFEEIRVNKGNLRIDDQVNNTENENSDDQRLREFFEIAYYTLTFLCANPQCEQIHELVFRELGNGERTFRDKALFHAISMYLYKAKGVINTNSSQWTQWIRIIKNLILNTSIGDKTYCDIIENINNFAEHWDSLLDYFATDGNVSVFSKEQVKEEQRKARIISQDTDFAGKIYEAEKHRYFSGQIRSALYLSEEDGKYNKDAFIQYWEKISSLFSNKDGDLKPVHGHLLRQAMLTFGDFTLLVDKDKYKTLCVDAPYYETSSMKRLFSNGDKTVKDFLDNLKLDDNVENQLKKMIEQSSVPKTDWRYCFIKFPSLFDRMSPSFLRLRNVNGNCLIVEGQVSNGLNDDVFLAALHESLKTFNISSAFKDHKGTWANGYLAVKKLHIRFRNGKFSIHDETGGDGNYETGTDDPIGEATDYLNRKINDETEKDTHDLR